jgi:hypothetical protein
MALCFSPAKLERIAGYGEEPVSGQVTCELCARPGALLLGFELPGFYLSLEFHHLVLLRFRTAPKKELDR